VASRCKCAEGCPACVGPALEIGDKARASALALLEGILEEEGSAEGGSEKLIADFGFRITGMRRQRSWGSGERRRWQNAGNDLYYLTTGIRL
jgi:hypothetical protein